MATLTQIISGPKTALTASLFSTTNCYLSVVEPKKMPVYPPTDKFAVVQPMRLGVKDRAFATTTPGRVNLIVSQTVIVWLFVRLALDQYPRSDSYLTDASLGSLTLTDSVIDLLQGYTIADGVNSFGYELDEVQWLTDEKDGVGWGVTKLVYHTDLTGRP